MNKETRSFIYGLIIVVLGLYDLDFRVGLFYIESYDQNFIDYALLVIDPLIAYMGFSRIHKSVD